MAQKGNLLTIRIPSFLNVITYKSKLWVSLFRFIEFFNRLLVIKGVWVVENFTFFDNNIVRVFVSVYYQYSRISVYNKKSLVKNLQSSSKNKINFKSILLVFNNYKNFYNNYIISFNLLNSFKNKRLVTLLFSKLKKYRPILFIRQFNFFIDFLKLTGLFIINKINLKFYINILGRIFKFLSKRLHTKYLRFIKILFSIILDYSFLNEVCSVNFYSIKGFKFLISGRLRGKQRSSSRCVSLGRIPIQSISKNIDYFNTHIYTLYGVFGIKIWIYKK